jgi:ketosteroid isomerase-like protein
MKTFPLLATIPALLLPLVSIHADEAADKEQVRALEKSCVAALLKGDPQPLAEIFAEDWILVDAAGQTHKRDEIFKTLSDGELKFFAYELRDMDIHVIGDTAVVIGHGHPRGQIHGEMFEENEVFTDTFARIGGKWRCILSHSVDLPEEQK